MLALTVKQPWAWATAEGIKDVENRRWRPPGKLIGARVAIHAGKAWDEVGESYFRHLMEGRVYIVQDIRGAVIAVATFSDFVTLEHESPFFFGPYGFVWSDVVKLERPVPCRGALNFWRLPDDVAAAVEAQLGD